MWGVSCVDGARPKVSVVDGDKGAKATVLTPWFCILDLELAVKLEVDVFL